MEAIFKYPVTETTEQETKPETFSRQVQKAESTTKKKKTNKNGDTNNNKRRFSDEQIKSLEFVFQLETKLEPRKKVQVARELGLQPRQVAIWFQNRRARWKSKQIEKEYKVLKANYDSLASCFESLKIERQSLLVQLEKLNELLRRSSEEPESIGKEIEATKTAIMQHQQLLDKNKNKNNTNIVATSTQNDHDRWNGNSGNEEERHHYDGQQQQIVMNKTEYADGSLVPLEKWGGFDLCGSQFDMSSYGGVSTSTNAASHWFNFWT